MELSVREKGYYSKLLLRMWGKKTGHLSCCLEDGGGVTRIDDNSRRTIGEPAYAR